MHRKKSSSKNKYILILVLIIFILLGIIAYLLFAKSTTASSVNNSEQSLTTPAVSTPVVKNQGTTSIPGFESLTLAAGEINQSISLSNPAENTCLFRISLILEEGKVIWTSDLIKPGESAPIVLKMPLEKGTYAESTLKYECFTDDDNHTPLNGAETKLILYFK